MAGRPRTRKRVSAVRRAPDGSAYEKCDECGAMVAIALVDMHECGEKRSEVKRFKGILGNKNDATNLTSSFDDQPRSGFVFFMESFRKNYGDRNSIDVGQEGFEKWKNMPMKERKPYLTQAAKVDSAYIRKLNDEANNTHMADDEANSSMVGKFDKFYERYDRESDYDSSCYSGYESFGTNEWEYEISLGC